MRLYTSCAVEKMIDAYAEANGIIETIEEGTLGYGFMIMYGEGLKTTIVQEVALNEWNSAHKIRSYNKMPEKYRKILDDFYDKYEQEETETLSEIIGRKMLRQA